MNIETLIVQPDDGIAPVLQFLRSATEEILVKQFTFDHPAILEEVLAQHKRGIRVRVMLNGVKSTGERINDNTFATLEAAGIPVSWSCPDFVVTHEKSVIVDRKRLLLATFNFMEKYFSHTRDYGLIVADGGAAAQLGACFDSDWDRVAFQPQHSHRLAWSPGNARSLVCDLIDQAASSIDIQHPKFAEPVVFERIHAALTRGVHVRVLCGGKHGLHQPDLMSSFALWRLFRDLGGKLHKQTNLRSHAKLILVDGAKALVSTQNLDQPAFDTRREVGIVVDDANVARQIASVFESDWGTSKRYEPPYPTSLLDDPDDESHQGCELVHD